jgi:nucleotide-binding universal stress UspA family protein
VKILLAVDGSETANRATAKLVESATAYREPPEVELVTVHLPVPPVGGLSGAVLSDEMLERYYREEGESALAASKAALGKAGIRFTPHILVGEIAPAIVAHAEKSGCQLIFMGTRGLSALSGMLLGSTAIKVLHLSPIPVTLVH